MLHNLIVEILLILCCLLGLADDMTHDDDGIVVEDALDIVGTLQGEGSLVVLEEGGYHHADAVVPAPGLTVEDVIARCLVETEGNRLYQATLVEGEGDIFYERAAVVLKGELHGHAAADDTVCQAVEVELGIAEDGGGAVVDKAGEHVVALVGEGGLHLIILAALDGVDDLIDGLGIEVGLLGNGGVGGLAHGGYGLLELHHRYLHLLLRATVDNDRCLGERRWIEHVHHHLQLTILSHLPRELVFIFQL